MTIISIAQSKVTNSPSKTIVQTNQSNESESVIKLEPSRDYYKEGNDAEFISRRNNKKVKSIRSVENWISLSCLAASIIMLVVAVIVLIHKKAKEKSNLKYLWA